MTQKTIHELISDIHQKLDYIIDLIRDDTLRYPGHETYLDNLNDDEDLKPSRHRK